MVKAYVRFPSFTVEMPNISEIGRPLYSHLKFNGKSPDVTRHCTLADSPEFDGSPPKSKGAIFGTTAKCGVENNLPNFQFFFHVHVMNHRRQGGKIWTEY